MSNQLLFTVTTFYALVLFLPLSTLILWLKPRAWLYLLTLFLGLVVGLLDYKSTEVSMSVLMLLAFGLFVGYGQPARAWLSGILLGIWVPAFAVIAAAMGITHPTSVELVTSTIAIVVALAGCYAGAIVNRGSRTIDSGEQVTG